MHERVRNSWIVVIASLIASAGVAWAEEATLDLDAIIAGIERSDVWRNHENWMVKYVNARTRIHPPPKAMVEWPDAEMVNARKGEWLTAHIRQASTQPRDKIVDHRMLWRDGKFTDRLDGQVQTGDNPNQMASYFWYPNSLMRDGLVSLLKVPKIAYALDPELSCVLPFCLQVKKEAYRVRKELEEIDGALCHVVERPGRDIMWIDDKHGFQVPRRTLFQESGQPLTEFRATNFRERSKGVWLPTRQLAVAYNFDRDPEEYRGRIRFVLTNVLLEARFGEVPDELFATPAAKKK
jgi:hypothetical protein